MELTKDSVVKKSDENLDNKNLIYSEKMGAELRRKMEDGQKRKRGADSESESDINLENEAQTRKKLKKEQNLIRHGQTPKTPQTLDALSKMMQGIKDTYKKDKEARFAKNGENQIFVVQAISAGFSSGNFAKIVINDSQVFVEKNESGNYRGLHIVVVNPKDANVEVAKVFDTYLSSDKLEEFIDK